MILFSGIIFYGINKINSFTKDKTIRIASIQNNEDPYENGLCTTCKNNTFN